MGGAEIGGAEAFFSRLVPALARAGVEQRVVIRRHRERAAQLREAGLETVELAFGGLLDLATPLRLRHQIKAFKPDIVLTWMNRATAKAPRGDFVHVGRLGGYYDLKYYWACDHLIANTEDIARYLVEEGWPQAKVHYLPNFVDATKAPPFDRKALYVPGGAPLVLALGRFHKNKAFDVLIEALAKVPGAYLCLAGEGPCRGELETLAERLGVKPRIRFIGWHEDTAPLFAAADVCVCPSRHEPLGNVVVEAWAHDVPVIAADSAGPGALIEPGKSGLLVPVDDAVSLSRAIRELLHDPRLGKRLAKGGRAAYKADFTEAKVVKRYLDFFEEIIK